MLPWMDTGFLGRTCKMAERGVAFYERKQQGCMELCLGKDEEPAESLYVCIRGQTKMGNVVVGVCYRLPDQEKVDEASSDNW